MIGIPSFSGGAIGIGKPVAGGTNNTLLSKDNSGNLASTNTLTSVTPSFGATAISGQVTNALGTITASTPFSITQTFNNAAIGFDSLTVTQTNTASLPGSNTFFKAIQSGTTLATIGDDYLSAVGGQKAGILGLYNSLGAYVALSVRSTGTAAIETDNGSAVRSKFSFYSDGAGVAVLQGDSSTGTPNRFSIQTSMPAMVFVNSAAGGGHYELESYTGFSGINPTVPIVPYQTASSDGSTLLISNNGQITPVAPLGVQGVDNAADLFTLYQSTTFKGGIDKDGGYKNFYAYTDASNYEGLSIKATSATVTLAALTAGTGADNINIVLTPAGTGIVSIGSQVSIPTGSTKGLVVGSSQFFEWSANNSAIYSSGSFSFDTAPKVQLISIAALAWLPAGSLTDTADLYLRRAAANVHAWRNGTAAQAGRIYNTWTDASNGEWATFDWVTTANTLTIGTLQNGSGVARNINITPSGNLLGLIKGASGSNLQVGLLTEETTIAAAATTDTTIQIPANAILLAVQVRTTTVIPTAATYTVTGTGSSTTFNTAAVGAAATSTDPGTAAGAFYNATAQTIRITPNATPADNTGRVRVTIRYLLSTPPTA